MINSAPAESTEYEAIVQGLLASREMHVIQCRLNNETLADIGLSLNLTRERIRQIESNSIRKLRRHRVHCENYIKMIEDCLDQQGGILSVQKATDTLRKRRLLSDSVFQDVASTFLFAQWMNVETRYKAYGDIVATEKEYKAFANRKDERNQALNQIDRVLKRTCGIISTQHPSITRIATSTELATLLNEESHELSLFSAEGASWLTILHGRYHIATQAAKVFCVCQKCDLGLLSEQLHRSLHARSFEGRDDVNPQVISEWIRVSGHFRIEGDLVSCIDEGSLSEDEDIAVKKLGERKSWLYTELRDHLEGALTKESLNRILQYSPVVICDKTGGRKRYIYRLLHRDTDSGITDNDPSLMNPAIDTSHEAFERIKPLHEVQFPAGPAEVAAQRFTTTTEYSRSPIVAEYILKNSGGICECCQGRAPFLRGNHEPYLEIHHVKMLSDGGSDTIGNTIAVCPNCHRELHHGMNRKQLQSALYARVSRLVRE
jgi:hypothetical protein